MGCCAGAGRASEVRGAAHLSAGINLTRIYRGQQSYLFYLTRDMGLLNKLFRGLAALNRAGTLEIRAESPSRRWRSRGSPSSTASPSAADARRCW
jgi:hypothetical protein